jgi:hypothetical protein
MNSHHLATFKVDITPPIGSPLCGGLVAPAKTIRSPLYALGVVILDASGPIVLCALDWCELRGEDHLQWRTQLAAAAGTSADRVAVQCVHQHDAPLVDSVGDRLVRERAGLTPMCDVPWAKATLDRVAEAVKKAMDQTQPLTHIAFGSADVERVASNRRVMGPDGKVRAVRYSACRDEAIRDAPEGTIDPALKVVSFWNGDRKLAVLHHYATHPMSAYCQGHVVSDFAGEARQQRAAADGSMHIYFNGCAGDITAGKYNDGSPAAREGLVRRLSDAMKQAEHNAQRVELRQIDWRTRDVLFEPSKALRDEAGLFNKTLEDPQVLESRRRSTAMGLSYADSLVKGQAIVLSTMVLNERIRLLYLPGEPLVAYQLWAQEQRPDQFVAVCGYGDGGPGYIPLEKSFAEGGYEPTWAFAAPESEALLKQEIGRLLA